MYFPIAERLTLAYVSVFLLSCVGQLATGFFEETVSEGLVMSSMLSKWKNTVCGRICAVLFSGVLFGALHLLMWHRIFWNWVYFRWLPFWFV